MNRYPYLPIALEVGTASMDGEAFVDTGYDGGLIIPENDAAAIDAAPVSHRMRMADGFLHVTDLGIASLEVRVVAFGDEFILGRKVLDQFEFCFEYGERVVVRQSR